MSNNVKCTWLLFLSFLGILMVSKASLQNCNTRAKNGILPFIQSVVPLSLAAMFRIRSVNAVETKLEYMPALKGLDYGKTRTLYSDFVQEPSGLQYKVIKEGTGKTPKRGDRAVVDWEGYTIVASLTGYYGRPFQTRNKVKGGAFDSTGTDYFRWVIGSGTAIPALDEAILHLKEDGIMQVIVPAELGYPSSDPEHVNVGPKPSTFSGQRALNFVLDNQNLLDKTLLINIRLTKVDVDYAQRKGIPLLTK